MENENYDEKFVRQSTERLSGIIERKMRTTFIGAISTIEQEFSEDLKNNQELRRILKNIRKKILDDGNNNIRALQKELKQYEIRWTGEKVIYIFKPKQGDKNVEE